MRSYALPVGLGVLGGLGSMAGKDVVPWARVLKEAAVCDSTETCHALLGPLAKLVNQTYTGTSNCSYYDPDHLTYMPQGWTLSEELKHDPSGGGMRALVFLEEAGGSHGRGVIAFRGTDLNMGGVSGQADECADKLLWDDDEEADLPSFCDAWSPFQLDYYARARDFTARVLERYPDRDWLFTGHSMGAGLAVLVALGDCCNDRTFPSLAFSTPPADTALSSRTCCAHPELKADPSLLLLLSDSDDPLFHESRGNLSGAATQCTWEDADPPLGCEVCYGPQEAWPVTTHRPSCAQCFAQRHIFGHYLDLVASAAPPSCDVVEPHKEK